MPHLFCFGLGFTAKALGAALRARGFRVSGTSRPGSEAGGGSLAFERGRPIADFAARFADLSHVLVSIPPDASGDPVLDAHGAALAALPALEWLGYLSTTGVYGDRSGGEVDETSRIAPATERAKRRAAAEAGWLGLWRGPGVPVHVFRLAGIYGPGRNQLVRARAGRARRIVKPGQLFSRIHVDDIAAVLMASMARPHAGAIYNVCDDEPAPPQDVVAHAHALLGLEPPPEIPFEEAGLSAMGRSFYAENRRVSNRRIKEELGVSLRYPSYREGLAALAEEL